MATEKEARARGYIFTGIYDHDKEKVKARGKEYPGYKTLLVNVPPSKLSRGHGGMGYSIYIEPRYARDQRIKALKEVIARESDKVAYAWAEYEKNVSAIRNETFLARGELAKLEAEKEN